MDFNFKPVFTVSKNKEIDELQREIQRLVTELNIVLRDIGQENLSPELMALVGASDDGK